MKDRESLINQASSLCVKKKKEKTALGAEHALGNSTEHLIAQALSTMLTRKTDRHQDTKNEESIQSIEKQKSENQTKSGYLWMKTSGVMHDWKRRFVEISNHSFKIYKNNQVIPYISFPTLLCSGKETNDSERLYSFEILTPDEAHHFLAENDIDLRNWITVLQNSTFSALNAQRIPDKYNNHDSPQMNSVFSSQRVSRDVIQDPLAILRAEAKENNYCADCGAHLPEWASINLGILICIQCSGVHRNIGTHISKVRSFTLDKCDENLLNAMRAVGNGQSNAFFENDHQAVEGRKREKKHINDRETWIKEKYVQKLYIKKPDLSKEGLNIQLYDNAKEGNALQLLQNILQGADINHHQKEHTNQTPLHVAVEKSNLVCLYYLISHRCDLDALDGNGQTALHYAALKSNFHQGSITSFLIFFFSKQR